MVKENILWKLTCPIIEHNTPLGLMTWDIRPSRVDANSVSLLTPLRGGPQWFIWTN